MREKPIYLLAIILLFITIRADTANAQETYFGYVNCQNLFLLHPIMQQFDLNTKRIKYTSSYPRPSEDVNSYTQRLKDKKELLEQQIKKLDKEFAPKIIGKSLVAQNQRWIFWKKREGLKTQIDLIDSAIERVAWENDYYMNMPEISTLFPATKAVTNSVIDTLNFLRDKHKINVIFDTSVFLRYTSTSISNPDAYKQTFLKLYSSYNVGKEEIQNASHVVFSSLAKRFNKLKNRPFLAGALDLSKEANELVYNININN